MPVPLPALSVLLLLALPLSAQSVRLLLDTHPNGSGATPGSILGPLPCQRQVLLALDDGVRGQELWISDGTTAGTRLFREFTPGAAGTRFEAAYLHGERTWLVLDRGQGEELWRTDGTVPGTQLVVTGAALGVTDLQGPLAMLGRVVLLNGDNRLWRSDGTAAGTFALAAPSAWRIVVWRDLAFVHVVPDDVWVTDGSVAFPGARNAEVEHAEGRLVLNERSGVGASVLYSRITLLDRPGQPSLTVNGPATLMHLPDRLLISTFVIGASQLLAWDGVSPAQNLATFVFGSLGRQRVGDRWLFVAADIATGVEPWVSDGTQQGTSVLDLNPGPQGSDPRIAGQAGDRLVLWVTLPATGTEPWVTDLTVAGTAPLPELQPGPGGAYLPVFAIAGPRVGQRRLLVPTGTPATGVELWLFDGTPGGMHFLGDAQAGPASSLPTLWRATRVGDTWLHVADDGVRGMEIHAVTVDGIAAPVPGCAGRRFTVTDPVLGAAMLLAADGLSPNEVGAVLLGLPAPALQVIGADCLLHVDPLASGPIGTIVPGPVGTWTQAFAVPNLASLQGAPFVVQPWFLDAGTGAIVGGPAAWTVPGR